MTVQKIKNRDTESERGTKRKDKNDSDKLTEQANDTPIQITSSFEAKQRLQPQDWERVEIRYWGKHQIPYISDVNRKSSNTETLALMLQYYVNRKKCGDKVEV